MLLGEDRRRHQHHHLLAVHRGLVRGAQRDLGLPVADVAADQAVHRPLALHVGLDRVDRLHLVGGLAVGEGGLEVQLQLAVRREGVAPADQALGVEVEQLAGHLLGGAPGAGLQVQPALAAQRAQLRLGAVGADVAADLGELVGGSEDLVASPVLQLEVVAGDVRERLRVEAREAGDPVVLVHHQIADPELDRLRDPVPRLGRGGGPAAVDQPRIGDHRQLQLGGDEALAQPGLREVQPGLGVGLGRQGRGVDAGEVVAGALGLSASLERDHRAVAGANQLLHLRLGLGRRPRGELRPLRAQRQLLLGVRAAQRERGASLEVVGDVHVEAPRVVPVHGGRHVLPVVTQGAGDLLLLGDRDEGALGHQVQRSLETVNGDQLREVRPLLLVGGVGDQVRELAVLGAQLRRGGQLDALGVAERALGEGREPAHRLDLVPEQLHPDRPLLGRRVGVEDVAPDRELAALLDLLAPLVARLGQQLGDVRQVHRFAHAQRQAVGAQLGVRDRLRQCDCPGHHDRGGFVREGRDRGHPQPGKVGRRSDVREVARAARGIEVHAPRGQERLQVGRHVAGGAVVRGHDQGRALAGPVRGVQQRGKEVGAQGRGDVRLGRPGGRGRRERRQGVAPIGQFQKWSQRHLGRS